jgi:very-short-patch-repair endonuclease
MTARKTLSLRGPAERKAAPPRIAWNVSDTRRERLKEMARAMRREPTEAESALWARLAGQKVGGFKFHRQVVIGSTVVDFACPARWLVIEISGDTTAELAALQDQKLADVGIRVLRFSEAQAREDGDAVIAAVLAELQKPFDRRKAVKANVAGRSPATVGEEAVFDTDTDEIAEQHAED